MWIIGGTLPLTAPEATRVLNTTLVFNPQGEEVARYDKIHLFSFEKGDESFDEARTIRPGLETRSFDAPFGRVGLSVCYDLRFPELYRRLGDCALIVVPSAFTYTTGRAHWRETAEIDRRTGPIQNYRLDACEVHGFFSSAPLFHRKVNRPPAAAAHNRKNVKS